MVEIFAIWESSLPQRHRRDRIEAPSGRQADFLYRRIFRGGLDASSCRMPAIVEGHGTTSRQAVLTQVNRTRASVP
jgi:hypothetical protein